MEVLSIDGNLRKDAFSFSQEKNLEQQLLAEKEAREGDLQLINKLEKEMSTVSRMLKAFMDIMKC